MKRTEVLLRQRERVLTNVLESKENRVKWLTELMDIDDEIEEMAIWAGKPGRVFTHTSKIRDP